MSNQYNMGYGFPQNFNYQQPQQFKSANPLTREEIASLKQKGSAFSLSVTEDEVRRGICFHKNEDGSSALVTTPDGLTHCTVCGKTWSSNELSVQEVEEATKVFLSVLQTIKLLYLNFPDQAAREFYQIIPLIEKVPQLWKIACDNFRTYEGQMTGYFGNQSNPFAIFGQLTGGANAFQYQQTQPMGMGMPMGYPQQPMGAPMNPFNAAGYPQMQQAPMGMPAAPMNPFDANAYAPQQQPVYGAPGAYAPQTPNGYAYAPGQAAPAQQVPAQQAAPATQAPATAAPAEVTSTGNHTP